MKKHQKLSIFLILLLILGSSLFAKNENSLVNIYKNGKVKFIKKLVISDESLPEGVFFESLTSIALDKNGKFINEVKIIGNESYPFGGKIINGCLWKRIMNEEGLYEIVKYKISN